jgi:hypothetical protein
MNTRTALRALMVAGASSIALGALAFVASRAPHTDATSPIAATPRASQASPVRKYSYEGITTTASRLIAAELLPSAAGADPLQVEPRVPRAAGTPCVVTLFRDAIIPVMSVFDPTFSYTPPAGCPGPWAKVKLIVEMSGPRQSGQPTSALALTFIPTQIFEPTETSGAFWAGAPQITADIPVWHMERDVTEYASILRTPKAGFFSGTYDNDNFDFEGVLEDTATALLVFYPATTATPAQRIADVVVPVSGFDPNAHLPSAAFTGAFPRNIERVYLDVIAHVEGGGSRSGQLRYWYACAPDDVWATYPYLANGYAIGDGRALTASVLQGCSGGNYREVEVRIDGRLAGLAPVFPWLGSNISNNFRSAVDAPAPSVQALNWMPYRVDLTPFAGVLNNGAEHTVEARIVDAANGFVSGHLLLYLDRARTILPGAGDTEHAGRIDAHRHQYVQRDHRHGGSVRQSSPHGPGCHAFGAVLPHRRLRGYLARPGDQHGPAAQLLPQHQYLRRHQLRGRRALHRLRRRLRTESSAHQFGRSHEPTPAGGHAAVGGQAVFGLPVGARLPACRRQSQRR